MMEIFECIVPFCGGTMTFNGWVWVCDTCLAGRESMTVVIEED